MGQDRQEKKREESLNVGCSRLARPWKREQSCEKRSAALYKNIRIKIDTEFHFMKQIRLTVGFTQGTTRNQHPLKEIKLLHHSLNKIGNISSAVYNTHVYKQF